MTRPVNLAIIGLTMLSAWLIIHPVEILLADFSFALRVMSAICIAAAGNVINDYFDRKVDLINKPERTYIDISVKRRVAIASHFLLNFVGIIAGWMGCRNGHGLWLICPCLTLAILWWYSAVLKRKFLSGNISVALCTAMVPLWAVCDILNKSILIAVLFAFATTLLREIVKDAEDEIGDKTLGYDTLAVRLGSEKTRVMLQRMTLIIMGLCLTLLAIYGETMQRIFFGLIMAELIVFLIQLKQSMHPQDFSKPSRTLKIIMLSGVLLLPWVFG